MLNPELIDLMLKKEILLSELITWLRAKGLYEEAMRDCPNGIKPSKGEEK